MEISSYSHVKTNAKVLEILAGDDLGGKKIVDIGAGEGYFCKMLGDHLQERHGVEPAAVLSACDLFPETFRYERIGCDRIDANGRLPYADDSFDAVTCIEVIEHIEDQFKLVRELYRITRPGGKVVVTTPNLLNINSRIRFFHSGFWLLYNPLPLHDDRPVYLGGHIHPVSYYYLAYIFHRTGFSAIRPHFDRMKRSAQAWSVLLSLPIRLCFALFRRALCAKEKELCEENRQLLDTINSREMLTARTVIIEGIK